MDLEKLWTGLASKLVNTLGTYRSHMTDLHIQQKNDRTLLTNADLAVESMIIQEIRGQDPDARILAEESHRGAWRPGGDGEPERIWVIDPIDGTAEFVKPQSSEFCSVVCLLEHRKPTAALIVAPELGTDRMPVVVIASRAKGTVLVNGRPAMPNTGRDPAFAASMTRSSGSRPPSHETFLIEAGYSLKTRTTSQTLDMLRTALDLTTLVQDTPRYDLFYRRRQKVWDGLAGLCIGDIAGLVSMNLNADENLPVSLETLAQAEPTFDSTVMGRPEVVAWFLKMAHSSDAAAPRSS